jgi:hypothetical protein
MPTMVSLNERSMLRDWVSLNWVGQGEVVEIGAFAGGSATALLQGMEAAKHPRALHVYDTFRFPKGGHEQTYRELISVDGSSFRPAFDLVMREWGHRLRVTEGDASEQRWTGAPIEILHIDCSISAEFHKKIAIEFYPHLMHGASLIHQDFEYENAPFIAQMMAKLAPHFMRMGKSGTTVYFCVQKPMKREDVEKALA